MKAELTACVFLFLSAGWGQDVIRNGTFGENNGSQAREWRFYNWGGDAKAALDRNVFTSAPFSLRVSGKGTAGALQSVTVEGGKTYLISGYMKSQDVIPRNNGGMRIGITDKQTKRYLMNGSPAGRWSPLKGSGDWRKFEERIRIPGNCREVEINLLYSCESGTGWFDDVQFRKEEAVHTENRSARLFPVDFQSKHWNLYGNIPGKLYLELSGRFSSKRTPAMEISFALPESIRLIGAHYARPKRTAEGVRYQACPVRMEENGSASVSLPGEMVRAIPVRGFGWMNFLELYFVSENRFAGKTFPVRYRISAEGHPQIESQFTVTVLQQRKEQRCADFQLLLGNTNTPLSPFPEVREAYDAFWKATSRSRFLLYGTTFWDRQGKETLFSLFKPILFLGSHIAIPLQFNLMGSPEEFADKPLARDLNGNVIRIAGCFGFEPYYAIEDPDGLIWDRLFPDEIRRRTEGFSEIRHIVWNFEPLYANAYSAENRKRFMKFAGLPAVPSLQDVKGKYHTLWNKFRADQNARLVDRFTKSVRKHFPGMKASVCTDVLQPEPPHLSSWCALDSRKIDSAVDSHMNMAYQGGKRFLELVEYNLGNLKKPNVFLVDPTEMDNRYYQRYTQEKILQNLLAAAALGTRGVGFWYYDCFDGKYLKALADGYSAIACAEKAYAEGRSKARFHADPQNVHKIEFEDDGRKGTVSYPDFQRDLRIFLHEYGEEYFITALNFHPRSTAIVRAALPELGDGVFQVMEVIESREYAGADPKNGFLFDVKPDGSALLRISRNKQPAESTVSAEELDAMLKQELDAVRSLKHTAPLEKNGAAISYSLLPASDAPGLTIRNAAGKVVLTPDKGIVCSWVLKGNHDFLVHNSMRGQIGELVLNDEKQKDTISFLPDSRNIDDKGSAVLSFRAKVSAYPGANPEFNPLEGLEIVKHVTLSPDARTITLRTELKNNSPRKNGMTFSLRFKNILFPGAAFAGLKPIGSIVAFRFNGETHKISAENSLIARKGAPFPSFLSGKYPTASWDGKPLELIAKEGKLQECGVIHPEGNVWEGIYSWSGTNFFTVEPYTGEIRLPYGESTSCTLKISR